MKMSETSVAFCRDVPFLDFGPAGRPAWWRELLSLWRPAGTRSGDLGLRLAIRNGYLNLYRKGQSVAHVSQDRNGQLHWRLHRNYLEIAAYKDAEVGSRYRLAPDYVQLAKWVKAAEGKAGREKKAIDEILDIDANVIDLEMGLPAGGSQKTAFRIDMVSLEHVDNATTRLRFWEVKSFDDSRIRARGDLSASSGILAQVDAYKRFPSDSDRAAQVLSAYQRCAKVLQSLAQSIEAEESLGSELRALANGKSLTLSEQPGLLVAMPMRELPTRSQSAWKEHRQKLVDKGIQVRIELVQALN